MADDGWMTDDGEQMDDGCGDAKVPSIRHPLSHPSSSICHLSSVVPSSVASGSAASIDFSAR
jgi:hypothetical protein